MQLIWEVTDNSKYILYGAIIHHSPKNPFNSYPYVDQWIQVAEIEWHELTCLSLALLRWGQYCLQFTSSYYEKTSNRIINKMEKIHRP